MSLVDDLLKTDCVKFGNFQLKSGEVSKYYFDMKGLIAHPQLMESIAEKIYEEFIQKFQCDLLCGVPMGGLPLCSYLSVSKKIPMIMIRDSVKDYGTNKQIEGTYHKKNKCIIIEDVITTGGSVNKIIDLLKDKVDVIGVVVILDRQEEFTCNVPVKSVFCKTDIIKQKEKL